MWFLGKCCNSSFTQKVLNGMGTFWTQKFLELSTWNKKYLDCHHRWKFSNMPTSYSFRMINDVFYVPSRLFYWQNVQQYNISHCNIISLIRTGFRTSHITTIMIQSCWSVNTTIVTDKWQFICFNNDGKIYSQIIYIWRIIR